MLQCSSGPGYSSRTKLGRNLGADVRGQQSASAANPAVCPWGYTVDELTLEAVPEPTTTALLILAGLACLSRSRRPGPGRRDGGH